MGIRINNYFYETRKYWMLYLLFLVVVSFSLMSVSNLLSPIKELIVFVFIAIIGVLFLVFTINKKIELHKSVFCVLLIVGILFSCLTPIFDVHDEQEHFVRAELTSRGELIPQFINNSYRSIQSVEILYGPDNVHLLPFESNAGSIDENPATQESAFAQNPFWGYLAQALGILVAKFLSLDAIFMLIFARIGNSILYAGLISLAIKKTPILKLPILAMACIPLALSQSFSVSIDALINGLGIFVVAYFLYLYKCESIRKKEMFFFTILVLILGLCKLPYLGLILLLFLIPKNNFIDKRDMYIPFICLIVTGVMGVLWYNLYAGAAYANSFRAEYFIRENISTALQMDFVTNNFPEFLTMVFNLPNYLYDTLFSLFTFSYVQYSYSSNFATALLIMFIGAICIFYPLDEKFNLKTKVITLLIALIIFVGTYLIQFFTWTPVGQTLIVGTQARYFIPLFALAPIIFSLNNNIPNKDMDNYVLTFIMGFIGVSILLVIFKFY